MDPTAVLRIVWKAGRQIEAAPTGLNANSVQECLSGRFPDARLDTQLLQLGRAFGQEIRGSHDRPRLTANPIAPRLMGRGPDARCAGLPEQPATIDLLCRPVEVDVVLGLPGVRIEVVALEVDRGLVSIQLQVELVSGR